MTTTDLTVDHGGLSLAVRDHGGDGPPILLLHGAGRSLVDFEPMLPSLIGAHRVVAMDLRGHGHSDVGPWEWDAVLGDVEAVLAAVRIETPSIAGHSLGGMIAAMYGAREACTAAVNIDGHGTGRPEQYIGLDADVVEARVEELRTISLRTLPDGPLPAEVAEVVRSATIAGAGALGIAEDVAIASWERSIRALPDGSYEMRPPKTVTEELLDALDNLDLFALYPKVNCPLLVFNAVRESPTPGAPDYLPELMAAYRRGLARDFAALEAANPHVTISTVDLTHALILEDPALIGSQVSEFVRKAAAG